MLNMKEAKDKLRYLKFSFINLPMKRSSEIKNVLHRDILIKLS